MAGGEAVVEVLDGLEARTGGDGRNRQRGGFEEMLGGGDPCGHYLALYGRAEDALERVFNGGQVVQNHNDDQHGDKYAFVYKGDFGET